MTEYLMVVLSEPAEGREDEYNDWYTNRHLAEVLTIPAIKAAQRFKIAGSAAPAMLPQQRYMAIYNVEAPSWEEAAAALEKTVASGAIYMSSAIDLTKVQSFFVEPIGEQMSAA